MKKLNTKNGKTLVVCKVTIPEYQFFYLASLAQQQQRTVSMVLESVIDEVMQ